MRRANARTGNNTQTGMGVLGRILLSALGVIVVLAVGVVGVLGFYQLNYGGRVFPGVKLAGMDLGGMRPEQVFNAAQAQSYYYRSRALTLKVGESKFVYRPADFGVGLDPAETARRAMSVGHEGDWALKLREQYQAWWNGIDISPVVLLQDGPAKNVLNKLAERTQQNPVNAQIELENNTAREIPSQKGSKIDVEAAFSQVRAAIQNGQNVELNLPATELAPQIGSVSDVVAQAARMVGNDLIVMVPKWDERDQPVGPVEAFRIRSADLPQFIVIEQEGDNYQIRFKREKMRGLIEPMAPAVTQASKNAKFTFDFDANQLKLSEPSKVGREIDIETTLDNLEAASHSDNRQAMLAVKTTQPAIPETATAQDLGIKELLVSATTGFKGSSQARIANVKVAAARFNGVIVPPKGTFSFNDIVGNISIEDGFEEGLVIVGNRTIKGVGGGVCQVSTTIYQAALKAGFPIVERYPHGYRVSYYEDKAYGLGPGFDATVYSPWADFKFVNDSDANILIETVYNPSKVTLTFNLYGTKDGREVTFSPADIANVKPPEADIYEKDTDNEVQPGQIKKLENAVNGATITAQRTVVRNGEILSQDTLISNYTAWPNRFKFGEGATLPEGAQMLDPAAPAQ